MLVTNRLEVEKCRILGASLDGNGESVLGVGPASEAPDFLAWSPNSDEIFWSLYATGGDPGAINVLDVGTGKSHRFVAIKDKLLSEIHWSPDGRALFVKYAQKGGNILRDQIGFLRSGREDIEPITRDTNRYKTLTLSADGKTIATVLARSYASISVLSKTGRSFGESRTVLTEEGGLNERSAVSWSADRSLLVSNADRLLRLGVDGEIQTQLLADSGASVFDPSSCGRDHLVLTWLYHGGPGWWNVRRTDADGSRPVRLTDGMADRGPVCSPDGRWVYYFDEAHDRISRVPSDGSGKAEGVFGIPKGYYLVWGVVSVSPDGRTIAAAMEQGGHGSPRIALFDLGSPHPPRMIEARRYLSGVQFAPDGKAIAYSSRENGVDNVWVQPLDGSAGHALTDFKSEQIWSFSLSPDGKSLALLRVRDRIAKFSQHAAGEVYLLADFHPGDGCYECKYAVHKSGSL